MKIGLIAFTMQGRNLAERIKKYLEEENQVLGYIVYKYKEESTLESFHKLSEVIPFLFKEMDALIFVGAAGIAVRAIAPFIQSKTTDPAVIVVDELGHFIIPLLSGHIGGANDLTKIIAGKIAGVPVITTATDINHKFSVDTWAVKNNLYISDMDMAKEISSLILSRKQVGIVSDIEIEGKLPKDLTYKRMEEGIYISNKYTGSPFKRTLQLIPKNLVIGIGCKRGMPDQTVEEHILRVLKNHKLSVYSMKKICSIDLKKDEEGIRRFASKYNIEYQTFSKEILNKVEGKFTSSDFVKRTVGVDNVCERSAAAGCSNGEILISKTPGNGVTVAVYREKVTIKF